MKHKSELSLGDVEIHKDVIEEIVYNTINDIKGVRLRNRTFLQHAASVFGLKSYPGITVNVSRNNELSLTVRIYIHFGLNIPAVAKEVQNDLKKALQGNVDVTIKNIHVHVQGVERGES